MHAVFRKYGAMPENMIGAYGEWAAKIAEDPARLSFRRERFADLEGWRRLARGRYLECLEQAGAGATPKATVVKREEFDGLAIEHLEWQLPYGPVTQAVVLKPAGARGKLPGIVGLHDHGGNKSFGLRKITKTAGGQHELMVDHQKRYYEGMAWANEIARRGFVVVVHDTYTFASRRVRWADVPAVIRGNNVEKDPDSVEEIRAYNTWAGTHEHLMAKSLFSAGLTWPGIFVWEDQRALDYLASREDVDAGRIGCCGLSGGGLRTVMLTGADERIKCSVCVGMMTTWRDYLLNKCHTHTWMCYLPGMPRDLDYPEILGLNVPNPVLVLNNRQDALFTMPEMERADRMLRSVYEKAGAGERYKGSFYDGPHKFDAEMQKEAWAWFGKWLQG